jgi:hypothetical protein
MPPDSSDIDAALVTKLSSDAMLLALCPNGVYFDLAPPNSTRFVLVSLVDELDGRQFEGRSFEDAVYLVKAVGQSKQGLPQPDVKGAARQIDTLLEGGALTVAGFTNMALQRERRVRFLEVDEVDPTIRWLHRGGHYRVVMST